MLVHKMYGILCTIFLGEYKVTPTGRQSFSAVWLFWRLSFQRGRSPFDQLESFAGHAFTVQYHPCCIGLTGLLASLFRFSIQSASKPGHFLVGQSFVGKLQYSNRAVRCCTWYAWSKTRKGYFIRSFALALLSFCAPCTRRRSIACVDIIIPMIMDTTVVSMQRIS